MILQKVATAKNVLFPTIAFSIMDSTFKIICDALHDLVSVTIRRLHGGSNACQCVPTLFSTFISFLSVCMS